LHILSLILEHSTTNRIETEKKKHKAAIISRLKIKTTN